MRCQFTSNKHRQNAKIENSLHQRSYNKQRLEVGPDTCIRCAPSYRWKRSTVTFKMIMQSMPKYTFLSGHFVYIKRCIQYAETPSYRAVPKRVGVADRGLTLDAVKSCCANKLPKAARMRRFSDTARLFCSEKSRIYVILWYSRALHMDLHHVDQQCILRTLHIYYSKRSVTEWPSSDLPLKALRLLHLFSACPFRLRSSLPKQH